MGRIYFCSSFWLLCSCAYAEDACAARTYDGVSRGFAHIEFGSVEAAAAGLEAGDMEPFVIQDRQLGLDFAPAMNDYRRTTAPHNKLYFYGFEGTESDMRSILDQENIAYRSIFRRAYSLASLCARLAASY